jgi:O-antigen/teichoic acid export membrane protein
MVTKTLSTTIQKVNTPLLAISGKDDEYKINAYSKLLRATTLLIFPATALLIVVAKPMIVFLIGEKWLPTVPFLQVLAISGMIYPVLNANSSLFEVLGRSDLILKSTLILRPLQIIILFVTINFSSIIVVWGIVTLSMFGFFLSYYFVNKTINCNIFNIVKVLLPALYISLLMGTIIYLVGYLGDNYFRSGIMFGVQSISGIIITIILFRLFKIKEFETIKEIIFSRFNLFWEKYFHFN